MEFVGELMGSNKRQAYDNPADPKPRKTLHGALEAGSSKASNIVSSKVHGQ